MSSLYGAHSELSGHTPGQAARLVSLHVSSECAPQGQGVLTCVCSATPTVVTGTLSLRQPVNSDRHNTTIPSAQAIGLCEAGLSSARSRPRHAQVSALPRALGEAVLSPTCGHGSTWLQLIFISPQAESTPPSAHTQREKGCSTEQPSGAHWELLWSRGPGSPGGGSPRDSGRKPTQGGAGPTGPQRGRAAGEPGSSTDPVLGMIGEPT